MFTNYIPLFIFFSFFHFLSSFFFFLLCRGPSPHPRLPRTTPRSTRMPKQLKRTQLPLAEIQIPSQATSLNSRICRQAWIKSIPIFKMQPNKLVSQLCIYALCQCATRSTEIPRQPHKHAYLMHTGAIFLSGASNENRHQQGGKRSGDNNLDGSGQRKSRPGEKCTHGPQPPALCSRARMRCSVSS